MKSIYLIDGKDEKNQNCQLQIDHEQSKTDEIDTVKVRFDSSYITIPIDDLIRVAIKIKK